MDVRCERCKAEFVIDEERLTPTGLTVQCTNCGHLFKVKKKELVVTVPVRPDDVTTTPLPITAAAPRGTQAGVPAAAVPRRPSSPGLPGGETPAREWRIRQPSGNLLTFRELTTLQKWIVEQKVARDDELSGSGQDWRRLGDIAALASFFQVVEAAERSRTQGALPAVPPPPPAARATPAHGVAAQAPLQAPPPPPSGFPPPAFTLPPVPPVPAPAPASIPAPSPPPVHDVDVSFEDEAPPRRKGGSRRLLVVAAAIAVVGGAALLAVPRFLTAPEPAAPPPAAPAPPAAAPAPPLPAPEPSPPPPEAAPAPAPAEPPAPPAPAVKEGQAPPPAPEVKPAAPAAKGPKALLARARTLLEKGDVEAALELYGRVASEDPGNVEALAGRGLCYLDLEKWAPAEASFQAALQLEPDHADALLGLAETYRFQGKMAEAIPAYERYLAAYPDGEEAQVAKNALAELRKSQ